MMEESNLSEAPEEDSQPNNLVMFRAAIANGFQDITKCVSEEEYLKIFTMPKLKQSVVKKLHKAMEKDLSKVLDETLIALVTDECMIEGMKKLAKLTEESTVPSDVELWRPPGDVNLHLRSLDGEKMKKECDNLELYITNMEKENEKLVKEVSERRQCIQSIHEHMKTLLNMPFKFSDLESTVKFNQECIEKLYDE